MWLGGIRREIERVFQVFLNRCPVQVRPFPLNSRTSPLSASVEASVPREQVLRAQGAHARTNTHAHLQLPLGFCVTCGCLNSSPIPTPADPFWGGLWPEGRRSLALPNAGPLNSLHVICVLFIGLLLSSGFLPFSFFPFVSPRFLHISNRPFRRPSLFGTELCLSFSPYVFLSLPHSCLDVRPFQTECFLSVCCQAKGHCPLGLWKEQIDRNNVLT